MKKIFLKPLLIFFLFYSSLAILYKFIEPYIDKQYLGIIVSIYSLLFSSIVILISKVEISFINFSKFRIKYLLLFILLFFLFAINNLFMIRFSGNNYLSKEYIENPIYFYLLIRFPIGALWEEFLYRGFIQNYVDSKMNHNIFGRYFTYGNLFASTLMLIAHLGFFTIMDIPFAISSLLLVFIFSITAGFLFDRTKNIVIVFTLHLFINYIHYFIHI